MVDFEKLKEENPQNDVGGFQGWGKKDVTYKDLILRQIELCRIEGSKQMVSGGKFQIKGQQGNPENVELFDQKKIFIQCVLSFHDLMLRYFDEEMKTQLKEIKESIGDKRKEILEYYTQTEPRPQSVKLAKVSGIISNPQLVEFFNNFKYEMHRKMYQELLLLFDRKHELSGKRTASIYK